MIQKLIGEADWGISCYFIAQRILRYAGRNRKKRTK